ncbi:hypothetical protein ACFL0V_05475 [Nanoarchaeota archaeon]
MEQLELPYTRRGYHKRVVEQPEGHPDYRASVTAKEVDELRRSGRESWRRTRNARGSYVASQVRH